MHYFTNAYAWYFTWLAYRVVCMEVVIDTGILSLPTPPNIPENTPAKSPLVERVLPSDGIITVLPEQMVVLTAFFNGSGEVGIARVLRSAGIPEQGSAGCCPSISVSHSETLYKQLLPRWKLNAQNPMFILHTPSTYQLIIRDDVDVVVTAQTYPQQGFNYGLDYRS